MSSNKRDKHSKEPNEKKNDVFLEELIQNKYNGISYQ